MAEKILICEVSERAETFISEAMRPSEFEKCMKNEYWGNQMLIGGGDNDNEEDEEIVLPGDQTRSRPIKELLLDDDNDQP